MTGTLADFGIRISLDPPQVGFIIVAQNLNHDEAVQMAITTAKKLFAKGIKDYVQIHPLDAGRYSVYRIPEEEGKCTENYPK